MRYINAKFIHSFIQHVPFVWCHIDQSHIPTISPTLLAVCLFVCCFPWWNRWDAYLNCISEPIIVRKEDGYLVGNPSSCGRNLKKKKKLRLNGTLVSVIAQRPAYYNNSRSFQESPTKNYDTRHASLPITSFQIQRHSAVALAVFHRLPSTGERTVSMEHIIWTAVTLTQSSAALRYLPNFLSHRSWSQICWMTETLSKEPLRLVRI